MIRSMTGYGRGECLSHNRRFKVEIKAVNHRYGDITIKLPRFLNPIEDAVRKRLARDILRGKADVYIHYETFTARDMRVTVNTAFADAYEHALRELSARYILPDGVTLSMLASHPDVLNIDKNTLDDNAQAELWETLSSALERALTQFNAMRETEGAALKRDLLEKRERVCALVGQIRERAPLVIQEHQKRMTERIDEVLKQANLQYDEARLLTEIALFADRACIDEELTRLDSHLAQMSAFLNESEPPEGAEPSAAKRRPDDAVGRKLDFLVQEINREANTVGSKSNDAATTRLVVELKSEVEKIREQVQNIE